MFVFFAFMCLKTFLGQSIRRYASQIKDLDLDDAMHLACDELTIQAGSVAIFINSADELLHLLWCALDNRP